MFAAAFDSLFGARVVNQKPAHTFGRQSIELTAVLPRLTLARELRKNFVNEFGGLQSVVAVFAVQPFLRDAAQFSINEFKQFVGRRRSARLPFLQQSRDVVGIGHSFKNFKSGKVKYNKVLTRIENL